MKASDQDEYVTDVKNILAQARQKTYAAINTAMVEAYSNDVIGQ